MTDKSLSATSLSTATKADNLASEVRNKIDDQKKIMNTEFFKSLNPVKNKKSRQYIIVIGIEFTVSLLLCIFFLHPRYYRDSESNQVRYGRFFICLLVVFLSILVLSFVIRKYT